MMLQKFIILCIIETTLSNSFQYHSYDPQPPTQDQCKDVNALEPIECPAKIGPPCPPCYTNHLPDYQKGDSLDYSTKEKQSITDFLEWYMDFWPKHYPPSKTVNGYNVFTGSAGRAQIYLRLYNHTQNETYLSIANEYIKHALSLLPSSQTSGAYMYGNTGVWILASIIQDILGNLKLKLQYLNEIINIFEAVQKGIIVGESMVQDIDLTKCGLDQGLTGMLYAALFVNKYYESNIISMDIISNLTFYILDFGIKTGESLNTNYIQYECPFIKDCYLWGPGHGASGIIHTVYTAYRRYPTALAQILSNKTYYDALKNTLDFFISIELPDGNMPTNVNGTCKKYYGDDPDERVQWCHGAPGFIDIFSESTQLFSENETASSIYLYGALRTANVTFERGLLVKGSMYCHGIGGNINMLWELAHKLQYLSQYGSRSFIAKLEADGYDLEFLKNQSVWRAKQFVIWTLDWNNINKTRIYDSDEGYSMYQGNFALPMTYIQMLSDGWPFDEPVCHPGWNLCL